MYTITWNYSFKEYEIRLDGDVIEWATTKVKANNLVKHLQNAGKKV